MLGTAGHNDAYAGIIHGRYRWPHFDLAAGPESWFEAIDDRELKSVLTGTAPAKFSGYELPVSLAEWQEAFGTWPMPEEPSRRDIITAYIDSFFKVSGEKPAADHVLAHCPNLTLDAGPILSDFPDARIIHIVRDPVTGLGDFRRRHPGFDATQFLVRWKMVNGAALEARACHPGAITIVRFEQLRDTRETSLRRVLEFLGLAFEPATTTPSWRGRPISDQDMGPFGGVPTIGAAHDARTLERVADQERTFLRSETAAILQSLDQSTIGTDLAG